MQITRDLAKAVGGWVGGWVVGMGGPLALDLLEVVYRLESILSLIRP